MCEVVIGLGSIPLAKYGTPGTPELSDALEPLIPQYDAILMSNHGVVAYADTLHNAYMKMETVEHFAQIALVTHLLGRQQPLEGEDLEKLKLARTRYQSTSSAIQALQRRRRQRPRPSPDEANAITAGELRYEREVRISVSQLKANS